MNMEMHREHNTDKSYTKAFSLLPTPVVPETLALQTIQIIKKKALRYTYLRAASWFSVWASGTLLTLYGAVSLYTDIQTTAAWDFVSLIWTDTYVVMSQFSTQFALVLLEAVPLFSTTLLLLGLTLVSVSLKKSVQSALSVRMAL